jgi:hypothetical protein
MNRILAPVYVANVPGLTAATLTVDDSADNYADRQVTLTDTALTIGPLQPVTVINFSAITSLTYNGGQTDDTFQINGVGFGTAIRIDGGGGVNTLDYTGYAGNVLVDLPLGVAIGFSGISNIQNVTGASGGPAGSFNILVGNGGNILTGGNGRRNLLIAGASASTLIGGDSGDILIGGTTDYDMDVASLHAIAASWAGTDDYAARVAHLTTGSDVPLLDASTVHRNGRGNRLLGGAGQNLYYGDLGLDSYNWDPASETFVSV